MPEEENSETEELKIAPLTNHLFIEAFSTIPVPPNYFEAVLNYRGVEITKQQDENYLKECREKGIIPFSKLQLYFNREGLAVPTLEFVCEEPFKDLVAGGRYNVVTITAELGWNNSRKLKAIDYALEKLPDFLDEGYQIIKGELGNKWLCLKADRAGIQLGCSSDEELEKLEKWFFGLKRKYHDNQPKPSAGRPVLEEMFCK